MTEESKTPEMAETDTPESDMPESDTPETPESDAEPTDEAPQASEPDVAAGETPEEDTEPEANADGETDDEAPQTEDDAPSAEDAAEAAAEDVEPEEPGEAEPQPEYDYAMLHDMNVHQLQEVAAGVDHEAVHGYSTMHKDDLVHALCVAFGVDEHVHHEIVGIDKFAVKAKISALKVERDEAFARGDKAGVKRARRRIHNLKHRLRKATV